MALTNSQYEQIMRTYEQHRLDNEHRRRRRYADIEKKIPRIRELTMRFPACPCSRPAAFWRETRPLWIP